MSVTAVVRECAWPRGGCAPSERGVRLGLLAGIIVAWLVLIVMLEPLQTMEGQTRTPARHAMAGMPAMSAMPGMPRMGATETASARGAGSSIFNLQFGLGVTIWAAMVVAMMLPTALPAVRHVARNTLRWRRRRAMTTFVAIYLAIWIAVGMVMLAAIGAFPILHGRHAFVVALTIAALWQLTGCKRRALRDCHRSSPLPPRGRGATLGVIRFAVLNASACVRSCWAMMLAMGVASSAMELWMALVATIVTIEKLSARPRRVSRSVALTLTASAALVGAVH